MKCEMVLFSGAYFFLFAGSSYDNPQTTKRKDKKAAAWFDGKRKEGEKCKAASAPVAIPFITSYGPSQLSLSPIYSIQS